MINTINGKSEHIEIKDYPGKWVIDDVEFFRGKKWFLLESETYGDEMYYLVVDIDGDVLTETYDTLICALYDTFGALRLDRGPFGC